MNIEDILNRWKEDSKVDRLELGEGSLLTQELHAKYIDIYFHERGQMLKLKQRHAKLKLLRTEYWMGLLSSDELKEYGWPPQPKRIPKQDLQLYLEGDDVFVEMDMRLQIQQEKLNVLDQILKSINQRGYHIKNAVDWERFKSGQ